MTHSIVIRPGPQGFSGAIKALERIVDDLQRDFKRFKEEQVPSFEVLKRPKPPVNNLAEADAAFIENLEAHNEEAYEMVMALQRSEGTGWKHVVTTPNGVTVETREMPTGSFTISSDAAAGKSMQG